jgi:hypothetical protein
MYMPITRDPKSYLIFINFMRSLAFIGIMTNHKLNYGQIQLC